MPFRTALVFLVTISACGGATSDPPATAEPTAAAPTTTEATTNTTATEANSTTVSVTDFVFGPASLSVTQGTEITFDNTKGFHNLNWVDAPFPDHLPAESAPWSVTFAADTAGTFAFWCSIHGLADGNGMAGTLIVTSP